MTRLSNRKYLLIYGEKETSYFTSPYKGDILSRGEAINRICSIITSKINCYLTRNV